MLLPGTAADIAGIDEDRVLHFPASVRFVHVAEEMQLRLDLLHPFSQFLTADRFALGGAVEDAVGWGMGDQEVDVIGNLLPEMTQFGASLIIERTDEAGNNGRAPYFDSLDLQLFVLQVVDAFRQLVAVVLGTGFQRPVHIAADEYLVAMRVGDEPVEEIADLLFPAVGNIAAVDQEVPPGKLYLPVPAVGIGDTDDGHGLRNLIVYVS